MISDLFFGGKLKGIDDLLIYEEEFVLFYLNMQLLDIKEFNKEKVEDVLENLYGKENIKNNGIIKFCMKHFYNKENNFSINISEDEFVLYTKVQEYEKNIEKYNNIDKKSFYNILEKEIFDKNINLYKKIEKFSYYYLYSNMLGIF